MGTVNLGRIMFQTKGTWAVGTSYVADDIVNHSGMTFICKTACTGEYPIITTHGGLNDQFWDIFQEGLNWRGAWADATVYYPNDVVRYGKSSYICRKYHTSSVNNRDPWYSPLNEWDIFVQGGEGHPRARVKMLQNRGPIGWTGHPFIPAPTWGNVAYTWNGNIPRNIPAAAKRWEWNNANGHSRSNQLRSQNWVTAEGKINKTGWGQYNTIAGSSTTGVGATNVDQSEMRDYYNNTNTTSGFKGSDYKNDTGSGQPTCVQFITCYDTSWMALMSNGTVIQMGYGGVGQNALGNFNDATTNGAVQINFPPGTYIVKIGLGNPAGTDSNTHHGALDSEGNLWTWGNNNLGQLGLGHEPTQNKSYGALNSANTDGAATGSYRDYENTPKKIPQWMFSDRRIVDFWMTGRGIHGCTFALDEAGTLWSWGYNGYGALGYSTASGFRFTDGSTVPFEVGRTGVGNTGINWATYGGIQKIVFSPSDNPANGYTSVYLLDGQGYMWFWGWSSTYMHGDNTTVTVTNATPTRLTLGPLGALNGAIYNFWVCGNGDTPTVFVRKSDGTTWAWGANNNYTLTDGTTVAKNYPVQTLGVTNALTISSSGHDENQGHWALCIDANNRTRIFGGSLNNYGCLGFGETGGTHATGGQNLGNFHRPNGYTQFYWGPVYIPAGDDRHGRIRDAVMCGGGSEIIGQVLFEDGTIMNTGCNQIDAGYYIPIFTANDGHAACLRRPSGSYN